MTGLVIGNSHAAAVYTAWSKTNDPDLDFLAIPGGWGPKIRLEGTRVFPEQTDRDVYCTVESAIEEGLELASFDYVALVSLGLTAVRDGSVQNPFRHLSLAEYTVSRSDDQLPVSKGFLEDSSRRSFESMPAVQALKDIKAQVGVPIICVQTPVPVISKLSEEHLLVKAYGPNLADAMSWYAHLQTRLVSEFAKAQGFEYIGPPDLNAAQRGSGKERHASNDAWHMNSVYGSLVVEQIRQTANLLSENSSASERH